ncbi:hypothetical protein [Anaerobacillus sp. 1_MG-2023]|nr:hypothetical protein [Anaerobacillus sp. 1_MG-2023]MDO6657427.1 hypothetical protein [Anaerobacillus sp. 1_MG-2023]
MDKSLSTFMKLAATALVIGLLVYGALYDKMGNVSDGISTYIEKN